jgi:hypothetical protein
VTGEGDPDDFWARVEANYRIPQMKGRHYRARVRSDARWHRDPVVRCRCGTPVNRDDEPKPQLCPWRYCMQVYCPTCGRETVGFGPVDCPCNRGGAGHGRYAEQPRPHVRIKR